MDEIKIITSEYKEFPMPMYELDYAANRERREQLRELVRERYGENGVIVLFGDFEREQLFFRQEPSFYYFTGVREPAVALTIECKSGKTTLFVPNFGKEREKWVAQSISPEVAVQDYGVDAIEYLGNPCTGYQCYPFFSLNQYENLIGYLQDVVKAKHSIFTLNPTTESSYVEQRFILQRIAQTLPDFSQALVDISDLVAQMRRKKSREEIELLYRAIFVTLDAHYAAAEHLEVGGKEYDVQAMIEYIFTTSGCTTAFPSIVATGKNSTILHYQEGMAEAKENDLVVVDIGAQYSGYCADLTRTYPASGSFTKRQREVYDAVLETQSYIAGLARPGFWLSNKNEPDKSLHHLAKAFLAEKGYDQYFTHGIGHFLGLDVHDVGDYTQPLEIGDVITIEPGIYIPEESIGIRIEDNYWIVENEAICLSEELPRSAEAIEEMVRGETE